MAVSGPQTTRHDSSPRMCSSHSVQPSFQESPVSEQGKCSLRRHSGFYRQVRRKCVGIKTDGRDVERGGRWRSSSYESKCIGG